jgi:hypothetical protein
MTERKTYPGPHRTDVSHRVPIHGRAPRFSPGLLEMRVLARINGVSCVGEIARDLELAPTEAMSVLECLERIGAVRWLGIVQLESDELEEEADSERVTSPDPSFDRATWPSAPPTAR